jgi:hypothetical protein
LLLSRAKPEERRGIKMKNTGLKNHPAGIDIWCSHVENGQMGIPRICIRDFECRHCSFYYWLEEAGAGAVSNEYSEAYVFQMEAA